jgi:beta-xylosidase
MQLTSRKIVRTILYADNQIIVAKSKDEIQMAANKLNKTAKKYDMKISSSKTKTIRLCDKNLLRVKIEIKGKIIELISNFNYLGHLNIKQGKVY